MLFAAFAAVFLTLWLLYALALPPLWRGLAAVANRAAATSMRFGFVKRVVHVASPFRDFLPVVLIVVAGALAAGVTGDAFLDLAEQVHAKSTTLNQFDARAHDWAVQRRNSGATLFFDGMSTVGGPFGVGAITLAALALLVMRRHLHRAAYLLFTAAGGGLLDWELKRTFARARPDVAEMLRQARGYSFPSGHAMGSTVVFGALAYVAIRTLKSWSAKSAVLALAVTLTVAVALSRVYLGVHWVSDVGAGVVGGLLWVTMTTVAYETFRRVHLIRAIGGGSAAAPGPDAGGGSRADRSA